jgi:hypothetical protein
MKLSVPTMDRTTKAKVVLFEPDLMFSSRIEALAARANLDLKTVTDFADLPRDVDMTHSTMLLVSLDSIEGKLSALRNYADQGLRIVGYYSHVNSHLAEEALLAGVRTVLSRGAFANKAQELFAEISGSS